VDVRGAQGGDANYGGLGGRVRAVIEVTPSETLQINVGGQPSGTGAGFGGGGATSGAGHRGGGASDVRRGSYAPADRLVVGGGGGGAGSNPSTLWSMGGAGGGLTAGAGTTSTCGAGGGGAGGSQSAGGGGGLSNGGAGSLGSGGAAPGNAGGGGGGYYGGGSGGNGCSIGSAGGGGSSYAISAASGIQHELGFNRGNGVVTISWPPEDLEPVTPDPGTQTFGFTGSPQWWTVPDGVTAVRVEMQGAQGGNANYGGLGGRLRATIPVTPGESLQVNVGGHPSGTAGGLGGGGSTSGSGTGGGGASDIRRQGLTVADRIVVAGGGGGGGGGASTVWSMGGAGGGVLAGTGGTSSCWTGGGGTGGSQSVGGTGGASSGGSGSLAGGGAAPGNAGGGGGYYGGGSGGNGCSIGSGGGGGSSYVTSAATGVEHDLGFNRGDGAVTISWPPTLDEPTLPASDSETFSSTGATQWWVVPDDVYAIQVDATGAQGGNATYGGLGGRVSATVAVTPGESLQVNVGGQPSGTAAGFGGGGASAVSGNRGGGASDIRRHGVTVADRVLVAAGGGGAGANPSATWSKGGGGGGLTGIAGGTSSCGAGGGGGAGSQSAGGTGGLNSGGAGAFGRGGTAPANAGGGGGGYYGGGSGGNGCSTGSGGGGGSSWAAPDTLDAFTESAVKSGNGEITITWPVVLLPERVFGFASYGEFVNGVHLGSGNLVEQTTDVSIATAGPDLEIARTYNSLDTHVGLFGKGWSSTYEISIATDGVNGDVMVSWPDGRRDLYLSDGSGGYETPAGFGSVLAATPGGGWTLTSKDKSSYGFDANGGLISIVDKYGRALDLGYGVDGLETITDPASDRAITLDYTGSRVTSVTTSSVTGTGYSGPLTWNCVYDGDLLTKVCDARDNNVSTGTCTAYSYTSDRLTEIVKPEGNTKRSASYGANGKVSWVENGTDDRYAFTYGAGITQITDPRDHVASYFYDAHYRTTRIIDPTFGITTYAYDDKGFRSKVVDATGRTESMTYDETGNLLSSTNAAGATAYFGYDVSGNLTSRRDERSTSSTDNTFKTTFTYNAAGDKLTEVSPPTSEQTSGVTKSWTFTTGSENDGWGTVPPGLLRTENPGQGDDTVYLYDDNGDLRRKTDAAGLATDYTYDGLGRLVSTTIDWGAGTATTTQTWDQVGNLLTEVGPAVTDTLAAPPETHQKQTHNTYDGNNNVTQVVVSDTGSSSSPTPARTTVMTYDDADRKVSTQDPEGGTSSVTYDDNGNIATQTDANGNVTATEYDAANRAVRVKLLDFVDDPVAPSTSRDVVLEETTYDAASRVVQRRVPASGVGGLSGQAAPSTPMRQYNLSYDTAGRLASVMLVGYRNRVGVSPATKNAVVLGYTYDAVGNILTEATGNGLRTVTRSYDQNSEFQTETLELGLVDQVTDMDYDALGKPTRRHVAQGSSTYEERFAYDDAGRLTSEAAENGAVDLVTTYDYDERGLRTSTTDPRGNLSGADPEDYRVEFEYDAAGQLVLTRSPSVDIEAVGGTSVPGQPTNAYNYDAVGNQRQVKDERGNVVTSSYDKLDRVVRVDQPSYTPPGGSPIAAYETFDYDAVGNLVSKRDRLGEVTDFDFDARNRVVRRVDPLVDGEAARGVSRYEYDDAGNAVATVDPTGARMAASYDDMDRVRTRTQHVRQPAAAQYHWLTDYDDLGNVVFEQDPTGVVMTHTYDAAARLLSSTDEGSNSWTYEYDVLGQATKATDPLDRTSSAVFDPAGRALSRSWGTVSNPTEATEYFDVDAVGNVVGSRSARSSSSSDTTYLTTFAFDALNRLTSATQPVDGTATIDGTFGYDAAGNLTRVTNGNNVATTYTYNPWGLVESTVEPSTAGQSSLADRTFTVIYDAAGLPVQTDAPGVTVERTFDELGRVVATAGSGTGVPPATTAFGYDLAGRRTAIDAPGGEVARTYDDRGLLLEETLPGSASVAAEFDYDAAGRMTSRSDIVGVTSSTYNDLGQPETITDPLTGVTSTYGWNAAGQVSTVDFAATTPATRTYTYNDRGWPESDILANTGGPLASTSYEYDHEGNVLRQTVAAAGNAGEGQRDYTYDRAGRLESETFDTTTTWFAYDGAGNRIEAGSTVYTYDERNRLTSAVDSSTNDVYAWTPRGTLDTVTHNSDPAIDVSYDALGRQVAWGDVSYDYDSLNRLGDRDGVALTYDGDEIDPVAYGDERYSRTASGDLLSVGGASAPGSGRLAGANDHHDLTWLLDADGAITDTRVWEAFGTSAGTTGTSAVSVGYQSDITDPDSGAVWMGARWYLPAVDSFAARDEVFGKLQTPISLNRYTYGENDPLGMYDPTGQGAWDRVKKGASAVKGAATKGWDETGGKVVTAADEHVVEPTMQAASSAKKSLESKVRSGYHALGRNTRGVRDWGKRFGDNTVLFGKGVGDAGKGLYNGVDTLVTNPTQITKSMQAAYRAEGGGFMGAVAAFNVVNPAAAVVRSTECLVNNMQAAEARGTGRCYASLLFDTTALVGTPAALKSMANLPATIANAGKGTASIVATVREVGVVAVAKDAATTAKVALRESAPSLLDELKGRSGGGTPAGGTPGGPGPGSSPDFVAGPIGSEPPVPVSQSRMAAGFEDAGFASKPTSSPGTEYTLPDGSKARLMEPAGPAPRRASFTNAKDGPINPFTGKPVQPPAPQGMSMKEWVRALTHVEQTP
jgi:RHS repeat-associated protein